MTTRARSNTVAGGDFDVVPAIRMSSHVERLTSCVSHPWLFGELDAFGAMQSYTASIFAHDDSYNVTHFVTGAILERVTQWSKADDVTHRVLHVLCVTKAAAQRACFDFLKSQNIARLQELYGLTVPAGASSATQITFKHRSRLFSVCFMNVADAVRLTVLPSALIVVDGERILASALAVRRVLLPCVRDTSGALVVRLFFRVSDAQPASIAFACNVFKKQKKFTLERHKYEHPNARYACTSISPDTINLYGDLLTPELTGISRKTLL